MPVEEKEDSLCALFIKDVACAEKQKYSKTCMSAHMHVCTHRITERI